MNTALDLLEKNPFSVNEKNNLNTNQSIKINGREKRKINMGSIFYKDGISFS